MEIAYEESAIIIEVNVVSIFESMAPCG